MTVIALAATSAAVAVLLVAVVLLGLNVRRLRHTTDVRVSEAVGDLSARMESTVGELSDALRQAQEEGRRNRFLGEISASLDLDDVMGRTLEAAGSLPGADAAVLDVDDATGPAATATLGLPPGEGERPAVPRPPDGRDARAVEIRYRYEDEALRGGELIHGGLALPVPGETGRLGTLAVFTRSATHRFDDDALHELEELARRAGPAIENARRFREARQLADLDALTGLHNRRFFHETLAREVARAHRYDRRLALIVFDVDDFKAVNDKIGHLAGDAVLAEVAERVRSVVRSADVPCRIGGDEFAVTMPESAVGDAEQLSHRLQAAVSSRPIAQVGRLEISAGAAELRPADDAAGLFERADEALYRAKEAGKGRVITANAS